MRYRSSLSTVRPKAARGAVTAAILQLGFSVCLLTSRSADAHPLDTFGFGGRNVALASAVAATVDDSAANYYNPANLTTVEIFALDVGYSYSAAFLELNGNDNDVDPSRGLHAGLVLPGQFGGLRFAFGAALFLPDERTSRVRSLPQRQPRWVIYDNRPQRVHITTNAALAFALPAGWGELRLGGGISFLTNTKGGLAATGRVFADPDRTVLMAEVNVDFKTVRYAGFGVTWVPTPALSIASVYRAEGKVQLDLTLEIDGDLDFNGRTLAGTFDLTSFNTNLFSPHQWWLSAAYRVAPRWLLMAELGYLLWSRYPASAAAIELDLAIADLPLKLPEPAAIVEPSFSNIVIVRAAVEHRVPLPYRLTLLVRAGYAFEPTAAPEQSHATNYVDNDKHLLSGGVGLDIAGLAPLLARPLSLDLAVQYAFLPERRHRKVSAVDLVGDFRSGGEMLTAAATMRVRF